MGWNVVGQIFGTFAADPLPGSCKRVKCLVMFCFLLFLFFIYLEPNCKAASITGIKEIIEHDGDLWDLK